MFSNLFVLVLEAFVTEILEFILPLDVNSGAV